jgi:PKD repeat protein
MKTSRFTALALSSSATALLLLTASCASTPDVVTPEIPPVASFTYAGQQFPLDTITFTNTSTNANTYYWDFGDSANSTETSPRHPYVQTGTYTVKLRAMGVGGTNNIAKPITISKCFQGVVEVPSAISTPTTWDGCHVYRITNAQVNVNAPLTIEAGAIVKFDNGAGLLAATGTITANGSSANPIIFTSWKDDSFGGDNNGDGTTSFPHKGDWHWISFGTSSGNSLNYCKVLYAGSGSVDAERALTMGNGANNVLTNSVIAHTAGGANQTAAALDMARCQHSCVATGNTFFDNGHPVIIGVASDFDNSSVFHNPVNPSETNLCNGIFVDCADITATDATWSATEVAFVFGGWSGNSWYMPTTVKRTLGDNVVLKFHRGPSTTGFSFYIPVGISQLVNYNGPGVEFTAYEDDSRKGDTNGDGPSTGTSGSWEGIETAGPNWYGWSNIHFAAH